jgi:uncharacterized protein (DUF486 family)
MGLVLVTVLMLIASNIFMTFAWYSMKQSLRWDFLWAGLCLCGAVVFLFRQGLSPHP